MDLDTFIDAIDDTVTAEVIEDGEYVIVNLTADDGTVLGLALSADAARRMAYVLNTLAAGL